MTSRVSTRVNLALPFFVLLPHSVLGQSSVDIPEPDAFDVPLLTKLDAPLKATLDISELNKQLAILIDKKVNAGVKKALENLVQETIEKRFQVSKNEIATWCNNTLGTVQNDLEGTYI